jgi:hypothetical protein
VPSAVAKLKPTQSQADRQSDRFARILEQARLDGILPCLPAVADARAKHPGVNWTHYQTEHPTDEEYRKWKTGRLRNSNGLYVLGPISILQSASRSKRRSCRPRGGLTITSLIQPTFVSTTRRRNSTRGSMFAVKAAYQSQSVACITLAVSIVGLRVIHPEMCR